MLIKIEFVLRYCDYLVYRSEIWLSWLGILPPAPLYLGLIFRSNYLARVQDHWGYNTPQTHSTRRESEAFAGFAT